MGYGTEVAPRRAFDGASDGDSVSVSVSEPPPDRSTIPRSQRQGGVAVSEVGFGSGISTDGMVLERNASSAGDEQGSGASASKEFLRNFGEGGSNILSTQGKKRPYHYMPHRS